MSNPDRRANRRKIASRPDRERGNTGSVSPFPFNQSCRAPRVAGCIGIVRHLPPNRPFPRIRRAPSSNSTSFARSRSTSTRRKPLSPSRQTRTFSGPRAFCSNRSSWSLEIQRRWLGSPVGRAHSAVCSAHGFSVQRRNCRRADRWTPQVARSQGSARLSARMSSGSKLLGVGVVACGDIRRRSVGIRNSSQRIRLSQSSPTRPSLLFQSMNCPTAVFQVRLPDSGSRRERFPTGLGRPIRPSTTGRPRRSRLK
jgi:hypothetical protein